MLIGVRNEAGDIYRLIGAAKINNFMNAVEELTDLGLVDELEDTEEPKDGLDAFSARVNRPLRAAAVVKVPPGKHCLGGRLYMRV